ncbi:TPA: hypothetical protein QDB07_001690 [Burkholderia vietnamiensis]|uniref:hypothetical protein n=1 Tax=Burkholderia vietnamiensis TaxID=60552 RepID=UPI001BA60A0A|nr:hypothetical protein [Burkholderia vietnamiensis]HDR9034221.1 hypothetical protein [Burkholderia vietnamiensis]
MKKANAIRLAVFVSIVAFACGWAANAARTNALERCSISSGVKISGQARIDCAQ